MTTDKLQIAGIRKPAPTLSARRNGCSLAQIEFSPAFCAASFRRCLADLNFLLDQAVEIGDKAVIGARPEGLGGSDLASEQMVAVRNHLRRCARRANQVPAGRKTIAHGFNRGRGYKRRKPRRDGRNGANECVFSFVPAGLDWL